VKKNNLLQIAVTTLLMANSFVAIAGTQYPAADFEPKVLYQDASVKSSAPTAPTATTKSAPEATPSAPVVEEAFDARYPATNFEPKVLYSDASYKHTKSAPSINTASSVSENESVAKVEKEGDSNLLFLGLLAAAAVGGFAFAKSSKTSAKVSHHSVYASGETGVTRYLNARIPKVSGVSKYLERNTIPTNVARYIARQNVAHKSSAQNDTDRG
jgi:hypothetical protein